MVALENGENADQKRGLNFALISFVVSLIAPIFLLGVMMATHVEYLSVETGFNFLTLTIGPKIAIAALAISILSLLISLFKSPVICGPWAVAAFLISLATVGGYYAYERALRAYPPIAEVATNWDRPISFSDALLKKRGPKAMEIVDDPFVPKNESLVWGGRRLAEINANTCVGAVGFPKGGLTSAKVMATLEGMKLQIFGHSDWRVEAIHQDPFYGFKHDVVIRIDPNGVDVRSSSREKMPDLGANCRLVTKIVKSLKEKT